MRERNLDLDLCDGFEWRGHVCVVTKWGEIIRERGGRERKEVMQAFQPYIHINI